jgi:hypothetical protein
MNAPFGAPLTARKSPSNLDANVGKQIEEGRHVGLDFYDLLIEALIAPLDSPRRHLPWSTEEQNVAVRVANLEASEDHRGYPWAAR